jgi:hypothetical protein
MFGTPLARSAARAKPHDTSPAFAKTPTFSNTRSFTVVAKGHGQLVPKGKKLLAAYEKYASSPPQ